jgi:hypothetical protein
VKGETVTIAKIIVRAATAMLVGCTAAGALADEALRVHAAEDGAVDLARQCDVYVAGVARSTRPDPLRYRWLDDGVEVASWQGVRADGSAPLELCGLPVGRHVLTLEVTDGARTAADSMTATIVAPALVARSDVR